MKAKIYLAFIFGAAMMFATSANAQCGSGGTGRYLTQVFNAFTLDSVIYSDTFSLKMDIYAPVGDTATSRPLVVLAHGGSFISGDREDDSTIVKLCKDLALKGYVTASIDYRLGSVLQFALDTTNVIEEVMQSIGDFKAAVRYFSKDAYTTNVYKVDTARMFVGGNSAGAVSAVHYAFIDSLGEVPTYLQNIIISAGGLDGNSGNPGYTDKIRGVVNLAGGLNNPDWIGACSLPIVSCQGTLDSTVPYVCGNALNGEIAVRLCGLGSMQPYITPNCTYYSSLTFPGAGHVPWQNDINLTGDMYQVDTIVTNFLYRSLCTSTPTTCPALATGFQAIRNNATISLFPNPASDQVNIESSEMMTGVTMYDATGRVVSEMTELNTVNYQLNTSHLSKGIYIVNIYNRNEPMPAVRKIVIE